MLVVCYCGGEVRDQLPRDSALSVRQRIGEWHVTFDRCISSIARAANCASVNLSSHKGLLCAITSCTHCLESKEAVLFCMQWKPGSEEWEAATWGLTTRRRANVCPYLKQMCRKGSPAVRRWCYAICCKAGWQELVEYAKKDINDKTQMADAIGVTLGFEARQYIKIVTIININ